jgi:hypothetical protein
MSGVFQNIDLPPPSLPGECVPFLVRGEDTLAGWRGGWGVNIWENYVLACCFCALLLYNLALFCSVIHVHHIKKIVKNLRRRLKNKHTNNILEDARTALYSTYVSTLCNVHARHHLVSCFCLPVERVLELKLVLGLVVLGAGDVGPDLQQLQQFVRRVEGRRQLIVTQRCTPLGLRKSAIIKSGVFTKMLDTGPRYKKNLVVW